MRNPYFGPIIVLYTLIIQRPLSSHSCAGSYMSML